MELEFKKPLQGQGTVILHAPNILCNNEQIIIEMQLGLGYTTFYGINYNKFYYYYDA